MKVYSEREEESIRDGDLVREWEASGLLDPGQGALLDSGLRTDLRRTNGFLRAVLWAFTTLIVVAGVALLTELLYPEGPFGRMTLYVISGLIVWSLAEFACWKRLYRHGVEEALGVTSTVLLAIGVGELFRGGGRVEDVAALIVGTLGGLALFYRFGFVYALVGSLICAAAIPFHLDTGIEVKCLLSAIIFAGVLVLVRRRRQRHTEPAGSGLATLESASWLGLYLILNVRLTATFFPYIWFFYSPYQASGPSFDRWFYGFSWAMIWILPAVGLWLGIRRKDRMMIDVGVFMALSTLTTNKRYLGWAVHPWDPMVLGILLMTAAILIRRWLQGGPGGEQNGFTSARLFRSDERKLAAISIASSMMQPHSSGSGQTAVQQEFREGGGQSGGGGASGTF